MICEKLHIYVIFTTSTNYFNFLKINLNLISYFKWL